MSEYKLLNKKVTDLSPTMNSGEALMLTTEFYDNGDGCKEGVFMNQTLTLQSSLNSASLNLSGIYVSPEILREAADDLEKALEEAVKINSQ